MSTLMADALARRVRFDNETLWVDLVDGRTLGVPLAYFPRLLRANPDQRSHFHLSGGGLGLHWDELDEDIHIPSLLMGIGDRSKRTA